MSDLIERLRYLVSHDALLNKPRIPQHVWKALLDGADALEQQRAEIERSNQSEKEGWRWAKECEDEVHRLRAEVETLRKDAERYRWLRDG